MLTTSELVNMGILMGIVHVLTGPDHLSSMATLSGSNIAEHNNTFTLGIKWGIGHSIGLLIVGGLLIAAEDETNNSEWIGMNPAWSYMFEWFVGVFMLALGFYGLRRACRNREILARKEHPPVDFVEMFSEQSSSEGGDDCDESMKSSVVLRMEDILADDKDDDVTNAVDKLINQAAGLADNIQNLIEDTDKDIRLPDEEELYKQHCKTSRKKSPETSPHMLRSGLSKSFTRILTKKAPPMKASSFVQKHGGENSIVSSHRSHENYHFVWYHCALCNTTSIWAIFAGVIHGIAGPGGVLGVIPALQLRDATMATIYLSTFCLTSTLVMGGFAAFYGTFSEWLSGGRHVFLVEAGSASLSIAVGIVWLILLSVGNMEEIFP